MTHTTPILGFAAYSGTGKTTLLEQLIPELRARGVRLAVLKHAHHQFDIDKPGKDSYRLRKAGAEQMLIASDQRWALMSETPEHPPGFDDLLAQFDHSQLDLILVEGFKGEVCPKIELHRRETGQPFIFPDTDDVIAVASDEVLPEVPGSLIQLDINDIQQIADFIVMRFLEEAKNHG